MGRKVPSTKNIPIIHAAVQPYDLISSFSLAVGDADGDVLKAVGLPHLAVIYPSREASVKDSHVRLFSFIRLRPCFVSKPLRAVTNPPE